MSTTLTLELPPEFLGLCEADEVAPETVLHGFIAGLCQLSTYDYRGIGSDERMLAW
jgi:hypothetical protein